MPQDSEMQPRAEAPMSDRFTLYTQYDEDGEEHGGPMDFQLHMEEREITGETRLLPKKIGDGNYGMVFKARNVANQIDYAIKMLYASPGSETGDVDEDRIERIRDELSIQSTIMDNLGELVRVPALQDFDPGFAGIATNPGQYIVLPCQSHHALTEFPERDTLRQLDINLSSYGYAMELFQGSLKDLVEAPLDEPSKAQTAKEPAPSPETDSPDGDGGTHRAAERDSPAAEEVPAAPQGNAQGKGYTRLERFEVRERERSALPVLESVARGLQVLHAASKRHQDIKPANVFYREAGDRLEFRLGDLGFLSPQNPRLAGSLGLQQGQPFIGLGTRHYRSIEQIDFADTAECDVHLLRDDAMRATLVTRDPKFLQTNIEVGDIAFFARSDAVQFLTIEEMDNHTAPPETRMKVCLANPAALDEEQRTFLIEDRNTQVCFAKNPSAKTDLFGLGAILYDILTAGASPERFYELLRRFDTHDFSIDGLMLKYDVWKGGLLDDPDIGAIFSRVNGRAISEGGVDARILTFLLKCVMSNANDSFYKLFNFAAAQLPPSDDPNAEIRPRLTAIGAWRKVIAEIRKLEDALGAQNYSDRNVNALTRSPPGNGVIVKPGDPPAPNLWRPLDVLDAYTQCRFPIKTADSGALEPMAHRWVMGTAFLDRLFRLISSIQPDAPTKLRSLAPERLLVEDRALKCPDSSVFEDEPSLVSRLIARDPLITRIRPFSHRYEPIWWRFGARRVLLSDAKDVAAQDNTARARIDAKLAYGDFSSVSRQPRLGDFILPNDGGAPVVLRVQDLTEGRALLDICYNGDDEAMRERATRVAQQVRSGYLVPKPDPLDYYAGMFAVYAYHFLISDGPEHQDFPAELHRAAEAFPVALAAPPSACRDQKARDEWGGVKTHLTHLIVWLSLGGYHFDSEGSYIEDRGTRWQQVRDELNAWLSDTNDYSKRGIGNWSLLRDERHDPEKDTELSDKFPDIIGAEEWNREILSYLASDRRQSGLRRLLRRGLRSQSA